MKKSIFQNKAFQASSTPGAFNLAPQINSFNSVFDTKPLDSLESNKLEKLLADGFQPGTIAEEQVSSDIDSLKQITAEIRAIGKQGIVLMGERVHRARELLKPYKDGTFTKWLEAAFGTRKTGYNSLAYYELYTALPHEGLRERFKKLQQRTAYILSSREGDIETKAEIISEYYDRSHEELVILIQEKLPTLSGDKRTKKSLIERLLFKLSDNIEMLRERKSYLTVKDKEEVVRLKETLASLIKDV